MRSVGRSPDLNAEPLRSGRSETHLEEETRKRKARNAVRSLRRSGFLFVKRRPRVQRPERDWPLFCISLSCVLGLQFLFLFRFSSTLRARRISLESKAKRIAKAEGDVQMEAPCESANGNHSTSFVHVSCARRAEGGFRERRGGAELSISSFYGTLFLFLLMCMEDCFSSRIYVPRRKAAQVSARSVLLKAQRVAGS